MANVLADLRNLVPLRPLSITEAFRLAEIQAARLLQFHKIAAPPVPEGIISTLPKVQVSRLSPLPVSGATRWTNGLWQIVLNGAESQVRQRFTLAHEFKHVLDAPFYKLLYSRFAGQSQEERMEQTCDWFAAACLMPRQLVTRAWRQGIQDLRTLARRFGVSQQAMRIRLLSIGLIEPSARCGRERIAA